MSINRCGEADGDVAGLGLCDLEGGFEFVLLNDFSDRGSGEDVLAYLHRGRQWSDYAGDPSFHLQRARLCLVQSEEGFCLVDLCLCGCKLDLNVLFVEIEILQTQLVLCRYLFCRAPRLLIRDP